MGDAITTALLIFTCAMVASADNHSSVEIEWWTDHRQDVFRGEYLHISCKIVNVPRCNGYYIMASQPNDQLAVRGCYHNKTLWRQHTSSWTYQTVGVGESHESCNATLAMVCKSYNTSLKIEAAYLFTAFKCGVVALVGASEDTTAFLQSSGINLTRILEPPKNLTMTVNTEGQEPASTTDSSTPVIEGSEFLLKCQSSVNNLFAYVIYRRDSMISNQSTYTPGVNDRCGLRVTCQDIEAANWTKGNTFTSRYIHPQFSTESGDITLKIEPPVVIEGQESTFTCLSAVDGITECTNITYRIVREMDGAVLSRSNVYTPGRDAFTMQCSLSTDANWLSGVSLLKSFPVEPIASTRTVAMEWLTKQLPQLYAGEYINITCEPVDITRCSAIMLIMKTSGGQDASIGCRLHQNGTWGYLNNYFTHRVDGFSAEQCNRMIPRECGQYKFSVILAANMRMSVLQCSVMEMTDPSTTISSSALDLSTVLDAPANLTMTIQTGRASEEIRTTKPTSAMVLAAVEGSEFTVSCQSTASTSSYDYAIYRADSLVSNQSTYTPGVDDRCGLRVACQDNVAVNWTGGYTFASKYIYPEFTPTSGEIAVRVEPSVIIEGQEFTYFCSSTVDAIAGCSNMTYEIRREKDGTLLSTNNTYTPEHEALKIWCKLSTLANWVSGVTLVTSYPVEPIASTRAVEMKWQTNQNRQLYIGELLNITCKPVDITRCALIALQMRKTDVQESLIGCQISESNKWVYLSNGLTHQIDGFSEEQCNRTIPLDCGQSNLSVTITEDLKMTTLQCVIMEMADPGSIISSSALQLTQILEVPEDLTMTIKTGDPSVETSTAEPTNSVAIEGSELLVECLSSASTSSYDYAIYRGDSMVSNQSTYTPSVNDRCGLRVTCQDNVAVGWMKGNTFISEIVYPEFTPQSGDIAVWTEPLVIVEGIKFTFFCLSAVDAIVECSNLTYDIRSQKDGALLSANNTYTPGRDPIILQCNLSTDANWITGVKLTTSLSVEPIANSRAVGMEWETLQKPQFYVGESLNIACHPLDITRCAAIAIEIRKANGQEALVGCQAKGNDTWGYFNNGITHHIDGFSEAKCSRTIPLDCGQHNMTLTIAADLEMSTLQCVVMEMADPGSIISSSALQLTNILEAPWNLTITIKTDGPLEETSTIESPSSVAVEGIQFLVMCLSSASTSLYEYAIYRGDTRVTNQSTYTPNFKDRCGLRVTCQDNVAVEWTGGNTFTSTFIYPKFTPLSGEIAVWTEPSVVVEGQEFTFFCQSAADAISECSNFTYEIRTQKYGAVLSTNNTYIPGRDSLILRCNLSTDANWISGVALTTSLSIEPIASSRAVGMEWLTTRKPQFYVSESLSITCQPVDITRCAAIMLFMMRSNGQESLIGCKAKGTDTWGYFNNGFTYPVHGFSEELCNSTIPRYCGQYSLRVTITADLERSMLMCAVSEMTDPTSLISSSALELTKILDGPLTTTSSADRLHDVLLSNDTVPVVEGLEFVVECQSSASTSAYDYAIFRGGSMVSNQSTYTPISKDRCGLTVTCQDNVAVNWTEGNTFASEFVYPEFTPRSGEIAAKIDPPLVVEGQELTFTCLSAVDAITECSNFTYEIRRQKDGVLLSTNSTYTPGRDDLILQCSFSTDANWVSGVKLARSVSVEPIASTRAIEMEWHTKQMPQLYLGESLNIMCKPVDITKCAAIALKITTRGGVEAHIGCLAKKGNATWEYFVDNRFAQQIDGFSEEQCRRTIPHDCGPFNLTMMLTADLEKSKLQCSVVETADPASTISSMPLKLTTILEVPENLTMTILIGQLLEESVVETYDAMDGQEVTEAIETSTNTIPVVERPEFFEEWISSSFTSVYGYGDPQPDQLKTMEVFTDTLPVTEGLKFNVTCKSSSSTSAYDYAIYRGESIVSSLSTYIPSVSDRCGLRVTCRDKVAVNWTGGNTFTFKYIYPEFKPTLESLNLRTESGKVVEEREFTFTCRTSVNGISGCSNYTYEIRRQRDGVLLSSNNTYTPGSDALILSCHLSTDAHWVSGVKLTTSLFVKPLPKPKAIQVEWQSRYKPDLYVGDQLNITCKPISIQRCLFIGLLMFTHDTLKAYAGCRYKPRENVWEFYNYSFVPGFDGINEHFCNKIITQDCGTYGLSGVLLAAMEGMSFQCAAVDMAESTEIMSSTVTLQRIMDNDH